MHIIDPNQMGALHTYIFCENHLLKMKICSVSPAGKTVHGEPVYAIPDEMLCEGALRSQISPEGNKMKMSYIKWFLRRFNYM